MRLLTHARDAQVAEEVCALLVAHVVVVLLHLLVVVSDVVAVVALANIVVAVILNVIRLNCFLSAPKGGAETTTRIACRQVICR